MNQLLINNETTYQFKYQNTFDQILKLILKALQITASTEVSLTIVDNARMRQLNQQYRSQDRPTDVLSFRQDYHKLLPLIGYFLLGDIYISYQKITTQALQYGHSLHREWSYLFAHGLMHLLGFDHVLKSEAKQMNQIVENVLQTLQIVR